MNGKGSGRRPTNITEAELAERWARTFSTERDGHLWPPLSPREPRHDEELGEEEDGYEV